jgi:DICT domain-containing protein
MTDETKKRAEAIQRAAEYRERAARYEALADEAKQRGDIEMSTKFASSAAEERIEARRIEEGIGKFGD